MKGSTAIQSLIEDRSAWAILIALAVLLLYWPALEYGYIEIDDGGQVFENPLVLEWTLRNVEQMFFSSVVGMYQPLTSITFAGLVNVFGVDDPFSQHLFDVLLHILNAILVLLLCRRLFASTATAGIIALLFAVHPLRVEAVVWLSARSTLMFSSFFLLTVIFYLRWLQDNSKQSYSLSLIAFIAGGFCKVLILPAVFILPMLDCLADRKPTDIKLSLAKAPFVVAGLFFGFIALSFRSGHAGMPLLPYDEVWLIAAQILFYPLKLLAPVGLSVVYDWPLQLSWTHYVAWPILGGLVILVFWFRANRLMVFGVGFLLANTLLHTVAFSAFLGPYADRYGYLSTLGALIALAALWPTGKRIAARRGFYSGCILAICFSAVTANQIPHWKDTVSIWSKNLNHQTATFSNAMRGALLYRDGKTQEALADFEAFDRRPDPRIDLVKLGILYNAMGTMLAARSLPQAQEAFAKALRARPDNYDYLINNAIISQKQGLFEQAESFLNRAIQVEPNNPQAPLLIARQNVSLGKVNEANKAFKWATDVDKDNPFTHLEYAVFLYQSNDRDAARETLERVRRLFEEAGQRAENNAIFLELDKRLNL